MQARGLGSPVLSTGDVAGEGVGGEDRLRKMGRHLGGHLTAASSALGNKLSDLAAGRRRASGARTGMPEARM